MLTTKSSHVLQLKDKKKRSGTNKETKDSTYLRGGLQIEFLSESNPDLFFFL